MKQNILVLVGVLSLAAPAVAFAHDGPGGNFALGVGLGSPTGLSLEMSSSRWTSFELAAGVDVFEGRGGYGHLVWKQSLARLAYGATVSVPFYLGVGGFIFDVDTGMEDDADLGVRVPVGLNFDFQRAPVQLFLELALNAALVHVNHEDDGWFAAGGYGGARVWF